MAPRLRVGNPAVALGLVALAIVVAVGAAWWLARETGQDGSVPSASVPGGSGPSRSVPGSASPGPSGGVGPVYVIVLENKEADEVVGNRQAPYFNELADRYGLATRYHGITHPSQPNYLALWSGETQGVADDGVHELTAPTLADQLETAGRSWRVFAEHVPDGCYRGATAGDGPDGAGTYARKHEPAISFVAVSGDPERCARIGDFQAFDPAAADLELIVPDLCHDMHDCSIAVGDAWLRGFVPRILQSDAWRRDGVLFITFDEGGVRNEVATLVIRPGMPAGQRSAVEHDHYGLLRTIEDRFGLPCLARSCRATPLSEFMGP